MVSFKPPIWRPVLNIRDPTVKRATSKQRAPKFFSHVDVFAHCDGTERLVATLNLEKLGWAANFKRLCGQISEIYVMESADERR